MRRPRKAPVRKEEGPRVNEAIKAREIQLIDQDGDNHGSVPLADALARAADAGMDLVEISPHADPPVCKILDYGKFKYLAQKKANEARKKQKTIDIKEIKMRPGIDTHDYEVKMKALERFIGHGDKVKVTLRFKGREVAHKELGRSLLEKVRDLAADYTKVELEPKMEGRQMMMVLAPK